MALSVGAEIGSDQCHLPLAPKPTSLARTLLSRALALFRVRSAIPWSRAAWAIVRLGTGSPPANMSRRKASASVRSVCSPEIGRQRIDDDEERLELPDGGVELRQVAAEIRVPTRSADLLDRGECVHTARVSPGRIEARSNRVTKAVLSRKQEDCPLRSHATVWPRPPPA